MQQQQHSEANEFLNKCTQESRGANRIPIEYQHTKEIDSFYQMSEPAMRALSESSTEIVRQILTTKGRRTRVRLTTSGREPRQELAKIVKVRLRDLDIHFPKSMFDCRISINMEINYSGDVQGELDPDKENGKVRSARRKDRLTYVHQGMQIDLTQVTMDKDGVKEQEHELELELDESLLKSETDRIQRGEPNNYVDLIRTCVDNIRVVTRMFPVRM